MPAFFRRGWRNVSQEGWELGVDPFFEDFDKGWWRLPWGVGEFHKGPYWNGEPYAHWAVLFTCTSKGLKEWLQGVRGLNGGHVFRVLPRDHGHEQWFGDSMGE